MYAAAQSALAMRSTDRSQAPKQCRARTASAQPAPKPEHPARRRTARLLATPAHGGQKERLS